MTTVDGGPAARLAARVRAGERDPVDIVEEALDAARRLDPVLHFLERLDADGARAAARRVDRRGPLAGVPILVKARTPAHAPIVERLVAAGAVPIGTSTRPRPGAIAQAYGWNGTDYTRNPWDLARSSGGSSAGAAAAVAAGVVPIATGGDSGGSLRIPAAFCGVTGFKGSYGRIPRPAPGPGRLTTAGLIGADLSDVVLATSLASGPHRLDPSALPPWPVPADEDRPYRVAYFAALAGSAADPAVDRVVRARLGAFEVVGMPLDLRPPGPAWQVLYALDNGRAMTGLTEAAAIRRHNENALADLFDQVDALVTPTTPGVAYGYDQHETGMSAGDLCWGFNVTGHPAVTVPAGLVGGLPVGAQVVATHGRDDLAVAVAARVATVLPPPPHRA